MNICHVVFRQECEDATSIKSNDYRLLSIIYTLFFKASALKGFSCISSFSRFLSYKKKCRGLLFQTLNGKTLLDVHLHMVNELLPWKLDTLYSSQSLLTQREAINQSSTMDNWQLFKKWPIISPSWVLNPSEHTSSHCHWYFLSLLPVKLHSQTFVCSVCSLPHTS